MTLDDAVAQEWTHIYSLHTHGLSGRYQPGALNESFSDIFGEAIDVLNGPTLPDGPRTGDGCSAYGRQPAVLVIDSPPAIEGSVDTQGASFGPALDTTGVAGDVVSRTAAMETPRPAIPS